MTTVNVYVPTHPKDHVEHLLALAEGIPGANPIRLDEGYSPSDVAVVFGVGKRAVPSSYARGAIIWEHRFRQRKPILVMERGFVKREQYYGVAWNGLNGLGDFCNQDCPPDRWEALETEIKPWKTDGEYTLVCGQVPWDASVQHTDHVAWCRSIISRIQELTDRPVVFRPHPEVKDYDYGVEPSGKTFEEDLAGAYAVVTFSSTSSALAILEGVPVFALDQGSMAWDIGMRQLTREALESPDRPDREQWAWNLAYAQWTAQEMAQGLPWTRLKEKLG